MTEYGEYEVLGTFKFLGCEPGETFVARLDPRHERRAIDRGTVRLLRRLTPSIEPGSFRLPEGWPDNRPHPDHQGRQTASLS